VVNSLSFQEFYTRFYTLPRPVQDAMLVQAYPVTMRPPTGPQMLRIPSDAALIEAEGRHGK
jgi:hypothetical protein